MQKSGTLFPFKEKADVENQHFFNIISGIDKMDSGEIVSCGIYH